MLFLFFLKICRTKITNLSKTRLFNAHDAWLCVNSWSVCMISERERERERERESGVTEKKTYIGNVSVSEGDST